MLVNKVIEDAGGATNMPVSKKYRGICTCSSVNLTYMYMYTVNEVVAGPKRKGPRYYADLELIYN